MPGARLVQRPGSLKAYRNLGDLGIRQLDPARARRGRALGSFGGKGVGGVSLRTAGRCAFPIPF
jgi:hypothetical protein